MAAKQKLQELLSRITEGPDVKPSGDGAQEGGGNGRGGRTAWHDDGGGQLLTAGRERQQRHLEARVAAAELRTAQLEVELNTKCQQLEREQARRQEQAAAGKQQELRVLMLETKLRVLLECYQHLEASSFGAQPPGGLGQQRAAAERCIQMPPHPLPSPEKEGSVMALRWWSGERGRPAPESCIPGSHLALANRCAKLECSLLQQQQGHVGLVEEAAQLQEEVQHLRGLIAKQQAAQQAQQAGAGSAMGAPGLQSLQVAAEQLRQAQALAAELRQQLAAKEAALQASEARNAKLQQDLKLMLGARDAIAALKSTLQQAVT